MSRDSRVLEVIKELAKDKGRRLTLPVIYQSVINAGVYVSRKAIQDSLKRLEGLGKIKAEDLNHVLVLEE